MDLKIENLTKRYGPQLAVNNISFEIKSGEIVGFLGPNGAGKTTTMKMLTQYIEPDQGKISYGNSRAHTKEIRRDIGYLPEHNPLYEDMPVLDYLAFCAELQGVEKSKINNRLRDMVVLCGLDVEKHKKIGELSKGYRQRVGLAQAIIHNPKVLILDEPTTGLDPNQIVEIRELIRKLGREKTVILSTHILPEVEATCDRILIINKGSIVANGTVSDLRKKSEGNIILQVEIEGVEQATLIDKLSALEGVKSIDFIGDNRSRLEVAADITADINRKIYRLCKYENWDLLAMIPMETKLEDIFRDLTIK